MRQPETAPQALLLGPRVRVQVCRSYVEMGVLGARVIVETLLRRPDAVISLTTGHTPAGLYQVLPALCAQQGIDLARAQYISSEEYLGVSAESPISLFGWLNRDVFMPNGIPTERVLRLTGDAPRLEEECRRFDVAIEQGGGIDLVLQTIGVNGHFGFNEPGSSATAPSRAVELTAATREANLRYWPPETVVPTCGLTIGPRQVLRARRVLLMAAGAAKAHALVQALVGPIDSSNPCSLLRLAPHLTVIADDAAGRLLAHRSSVHL